MKKMLLAAIIVGIVSALAVLYSAEAISDNTAETPLQ